MPEEILATKNAGKKNEKTIFFCINEITSTFEWQELENCKRNFSKVILLTNDTNCLSLKSPDLDVCILDYKLYNSTGYLLKSLRFSGLFLRELFSSKKYFTNPGLFVKVLSMFFRSHYLADKMNTELQKIKTSPGHTLLYSFWFNHWVTAMAILKCKQPTIRYISRAHGTDLFEERVPQTRRIAFRAFQLKRADKIFPVSEAGTNYLKDKYPHYAKKVFTSKLGTFFNGLNPYHENAKFTLVSCARIRNVKRIHLIAEILANIQFPVKWIHIGGENKNDPTLPLLKRNLDNLKLKNKQAEIVFAGDRSVKEVFEIYQNEPIHLFLSVSETEGLPVSMMEAISFGIPLMATDVGGCKEIVTNQTGMLLPPDFDPEKVAHEITQFKDSGRNSEKFRAGVHEFWKTNYNAEINFSRFMELVN